MELLYMGTGAAEGIPATFCTCAVCREAKKRGGRDIRTRSQALIDGKILLDFCPDTYFHYLCAPHLHYDFDLPAITHVFITHSHMDHFFPAELELRTEGFVHTPAPVLQLYGNERVEQKLLAVLPKPDPALYKMNFHKIGPFEKIDAQGFRITSLRARHDPKETCLFYAIEKAGKSILYAHDTGAFPEDTWDWLKAAGIKFDLVSLDCTMMTIKEGTNHMGIADAVEARQDLTRIKAADKNTLFVLNHFSHNGGLNHDELCREAEKEHFLVSWDGLQVTV
jgi:phosphoribosyl 1,2-cyclic phosphate phosphodiesterase